MKMLRTASLGSNFTDSYKKKCTVYIYIIVDTRRKLNVHKAFRRRPGCLRNVLCTSNLRPVSTGIYYRVYDSIR